MVIEKLHGLQATSITLNDRFTLLSTAGTDRAAMRMKKRPTVHQYLTQTLNIRNRFLIDQIARKLEYQMKRATLRQRLGLGQAPFHQFDNRNTFQSLMRSNSTSNLSNRSVKTRIGRRQFNGNLNRSASFGDLSMAGAGRPLRGFRRRGGGPRAVRGRFSRGAGQQSGRVTRVAQRGRPATRPTGRVLRSQQQKPVPSREQLDAELDQYMASSKSALDLELEAYMREAELLE